MFRSRIKLFSLMGFEVSIDLSWLVIAVLVVWSLASGLFPYLYEGLPKSTYLGMGIAGALGLFISIIIHEFCHSLVARRNGMPIRGITLFIFGGVAEMSDEPPNAMAEFKMAAVGPLSSIVIAVVFYVAGRMGAETLPAPVSGVIRYLAMINAVLAAFNLLPAYPLDGGRMLRSIIWRVKKDIRPATRISSKIGAGFAYGFMFLGIMFILRGNFIGGMWWVLIGMFLQNATKMSYQQLLVRQALSGEPVSRLMVRNPVTVSPDLFVSELVDEYIYKYHFKMFPVANGDNLTGCVTTREVKAVPREQWEKKTVGDIASPPTSENTIGPDTDALEVFSRMNKTGSGRLMVVDGRKLVGVITLKDLMRFLSVRMDLGKE